MTEDAPFLPGLSPVGGKPVHVAFDGGRMSSDAGVLVLAEIERRLGLADRLARCLEDPRAPERVRHGLAEMIRFRALLIAAGYADANDCDALRHDPAFKMAVGRLPETGAELCSQPTMCRLENLPTETVLVRMMAAMVELFCDSFEQVPRRILLDIDDTLDRVHGHQQLSLFHAHYDSRCFLPIHVYEATTSKPVAVILRPGKTPDGTEVAMVLRHVVRAIRARWPRVDIVIRGDGHYARPEAMDWLERHRVGYVFGLAGAPRWLYEHLYCGRGQAENLVKAHKLHLGSDRTSCSKATANQFRLLIHTAAYWLLHTLRGLAPKTSFWCCAQFDTLRLAFIKIAARVTERVTRIKVSLPSSYPHQQSFARFADRARALPP